MAKTIVSVSFSNGFVGDATKNNESSASSYLNALGWSNLQFQQATDNGLFGGTQGNDLSGTILITDALGVQHRIDGVINWRAPSGSVSTMVFYATGSTSHTLAVSGGGTKVIDPYTEANGDPHSFIGLTYNGQTLAISGGKVTGNAATSGLIDSLNDYLRDQPQLTIGDAVVNEGAGTATLTVSLSKATADTVSVKWATQNGSASAGADYTGGGNTLVFGPNETSKTITVPIVDNATVDGARAFNLVLSDSTFAAIVDNTGVVTINDNDAASPIPSPAVVTGVSAEDGANLGRVPVDSSIDEGGSLVYTVTLSGSTGGEYALSVGGSAAASDLGALSFTGGVAWKNGSAASGAIVVPAGVTSFKVTVPTIDDSAIESSETAVLSVGGQSATGTIVDNDVQGVTGVSGGASVAEGASLLYTVALSAASPAPVEHTLVVSGSAGALDVGSFVFSAGVAWKNGDPATGIVVVPANVSSFTVSVPTVDDAEVEATETVVLTVGGKAAGGSILDNDVPPAPGAPTVAGVAATAAGVTEGAGLRYTVTLSAGGASPSEHAVTSGGSAAGADLGAWVFSDGVAWKNNDAGSGVLVVPAGVAGFTVDVPTVDDALIELTETLVLEIGGKSATASILDNDNQAVTGVTAGAAVIEGAALSYTVALSAASPYAVEHQLVLSGTAGAADRGALVFSDNVVWKNGDAATGIVVVPTGVTGFTVSVATVDDTVVELSETLVLSVGGSSATGTIADNDRVQVASVAAHDAARSGDSVVEGASLQYTVVLNATTLAPEEYRVVLGGSAGSLDRGALAFSDNVAWKNGDPATGIVVVPAGVASFVATLPTLEDSVIENRETAVLTVGGVDATGNILDDDVQTVAGVSAGSAVVEGAALSYTVALSAASPYPVEHQLAVSGSAAAADRGALVFSDNVAWKNGDPGSGIVVVPAGVATFTVTVPTVDDTLVESLETVVVGVGASSATGSIQDNDLQTVASVVAEDAAHTGAAPIDSAVGEGASLLYTVALSAASAYAVEHSLAVAGSAGAADLAAFVFSHGVAWKNNDAASGIVVVPAGITSFTVTVPTVDDALIESAETVVLTIGGVDATGTITDNDSQAVTSVLAEDAAHTGAAPVDSAVGEGQTLLYTVALNAASPVAVEHTLVLSGSVSADDLGAFVFSAGVAWKNGDARSGIVVVPAGVTSFTVTVPTVDDSLIEGADVAVLAVGGVSAAGIITDNDSQAVVSVLAEDAAHSGAMPVDSSVEEGAALLYTVALNAPSPMPTDHSLRVSGTAGAGDLAAFRFSAGVAWLNNDPRSGQIVVPAGVTSFTITVPTVDDREVESAESLVLEVGGVAAAGTILDNDQVHVASVLAEDGAHSGAVPVDNAVVEGGFLLYTVALTAPAVARTEFALGLGGTADRLDHGALYFSDGVAWKDGNPDSGIVVVPAGVGSFRIVVATTDDSAVELTESLSVTIGGVTGTGSISDNDSVSVKAVIAEDAGAVGLSPADTAVTEGWILRYTVQLNAAGVSPTEFRLAFGGSASAADIAGIAFSDGVQWKNGDPASGVIVVPAGVASFKISVATLDDDLIELTESLVATVGGVAATGSITDNDSQSLSSLKAEDAANPGALPVDSSVVEGNALLFTAALNGPSPTATEYTLALGGSATAADLGALSFSQGVDWKDGDPASGRIVVAAGVAAFTVLLQTRDDALVEATESVVLNIGGMSASGSILDNDSLAVSAVQAEDAAGRDPVDATVTEGGTLVYRVLLNGVAQAAAEFSLALGGTASNADLGALVFSDGVAWKKGDPASGAIVVPAGVGAFTVTLATVDDTLVEASESAVLVVNGAQATGTILDNDFVLPLPQPEPKPEPQPEPKPEPKPEPIPETPPTLATGLDPALDDGPSNSDTVTSVRTPEFTLQGGQLAAGGSVRLLSPAGEVVGATVVTAADVVAGRVNVGPGPLDDGVYTYTAQVMDASGKVVASAPVTVTVVTDLDGVTPSIELAAHGGDYNRDGILDWQQHSVAHMPLRSLADFALGKDAPVAAFGAIMAGSLGTQAGSVQLTSGAQLKDLFLSDLPSALPQEIRAASPVFNFTIGAEEGVASLPDLDPSRPGLQTRVVIDLGANGAVSNDFMKFDRAANRWYSFLDDQDLATMDDGATLVDLNDDGRVDRIVLTLTDGARGDDDSVVDGKIVDPGLLAFDTTPPSQVYSVRMGGGETYYTADIADAKVKSTGTGNVFLGVAFDSMAEAPDAKHVSAYYQPFTKDMTFTIDGAEQPYACYELVAGANGFLARAAGKDQVDIHLFQNARGMTELVSLVQARELNLAAQGYLDRGAKFSVSVDNAFRFDAEGYLIANQENGSVQALVKQLATLYGSTGAAGFIEAVEQNYFEQIKLVGVAHGAAASAADLNAVFGTGFAN